MRAGRRGNEKEREYGALLYVWQSQVGVHESTLCILVPPLMEVPCYSALNVITWSKYAIEYDFYPGLPHVYMCT